MWHVDRLLDEFEVDQLQRALHRRRHDSQLLPRPVTSPSGDSLIEMPISPPGTGFSTAGQWPEVSQGLASQYGALPSTDMDADLAFWTSSAGWDDSELTLPLIEPGTLQRVSC